jgi:cytidylate kinase
MQIADAEGIRRVAERMVRTAAKEGNCVIVGRGSAYYLRDLPNAFNIFIYAPFEEKVRRLQQAGKSEKDAIERVQTIDLERAAFVKQYFGIEWPARQFFHLMLNSTMGDAAVVQTVLDSLSTIQTV